MVFDILMLMVLIGLCIESILKNVSNRRGTIIIWINFAITTLIRIIILLVRAPLERVLKRVRRSTIYAVTAVMSFMYSGHCLPYFDYMPEIVLSVDVGLIGLLLITGICIKLNAKRIHRAL
jgi:hypothetical protein